MQHNNVMSSEEKWKFVFSSLLKTPIDELDFDIQVKNGKILIKSDDKDKIAKLEEVIKSPEIMLSNLDYHLQKQSSQAVSNEIGTLQHTNYPKSLRPQHGKLLDYTKKILGKEVSKRIGKFDWQELNLENVNQFILQYHCNDELYIDLTKSEIQVLQGFFRSATYAELRHAFAEEEAERKCLVYHKNQKGILTPHVEKIIYFDEKTHTAYFDIGRLAQCLTPPVFDITQKNNQKLTTMTAEIDETHFKNYLALMHEGGVLLHVTTNQDDHTSSARPICFNVEQSLPSQIVVTFILDRSSSMNSPAFQNATDTAIQKLKSEVETFLEKLKNEKNYSIETTIRITSFSDTYESKEFYLRDLEEIKKYIQDNINAAGKTHLYSTVSKEINEIMQKYPNAANVVVLLTDGYDSIEHSKDRSDIEKQENRKKLDDLKKKLNDCQNPPKVWALSLGEETDKNALENIAVNTDGHFMELKDMRDFQGLYSYLDEMKKSRIVMHFMQEISDQITQFNVSVYENSFSIAKNLITIPGNFSINNEEYQVGLGGVRLIGAAEPEQKSEALSNEPIDYNKFIKNLSEEDKNAILQLLLANNKGSRSEPNVTQTDSGSRPSGSVAQNASSIFTPPIRPKSAEVDTSSFIEHPSPKGK